jgi:hypothetical protein
LFSASVFPFLLRATLQSSRKKLGEKKIGEFIGSYHMLQKEIVM